MCEVYAKSVIYDVITYYPSAAYKVKTDRTYTDTRNYYSFIGAVVAMRENDVITWLLQDQVNSTTITADANGNLLSETRYSAFGEVRYSNGTMVTDKLYTGQCDEFEIGLYYYVARYYDPVVGRFISADTLIPQPGSSQAYDRFAYVNNNPINFNDPSGYMIKDDFDSREGDNGIIRDLLLKRNVELIRQVKEGLINDKDALVKLVDYAAWFSPTCSSCFVQNVGAVLTGTTNGSAWVNEIQGQINPDKLDYHYNPKEQLGQSGFAPIFQDPGLGGSQPHHYWFYVQMGFEQSELKNGPSPIFPYIANVAHETIASRNIAGNSFQDLALGIEGANLGIELASGSISPSQVGNYIGQTLSPGSNNSIFWEQLYSGIIDSLTGASQSPLWFPN